MGFVVLHIQKPKGNDARTTAHIERTVQPGNADPERKALNKEFITFPDGAENRTQAIQYRIENAGINRKIRENQVRALQVMLSGTPEDMQRIQLTGKLDEWCKDNIEWLQDTFGKENIVSAVLHMEGYVLHNITFLMLAMQLCWHHDIDCSITTMYLHIYQHNHALILISRTSIRIYLLSRFGLSSGLRFHMFSGPRLSSAY